MLPDAIQCKRPGRPRGGTRPPPPGRRRRLDPHVRRRPTCCGCGGDERRGRVAQDRLQFGKFRRRDRALLRLVERDRTDRGHAAVEAAVVRLGERLHPASTPRGSGGRRRDRRAAERPAFQTFNGRVEPPCRRRTRRDPHSSTHDRASWPVRLDHLARTRRTRRRDPPFADRADRCRPGAAQVMTHFRRRRSRRAAGVLPEGPARQAVAPPPRCPELPAGSEGIAGRASRPSSPGSPGSRRWGGATSTRDWRLPGAVLPAAASKALRTLVRVSRLPLPACTTMRFFVWWKNGRSPWTHRLSAAMYRRRLRVRGHLRTTNVRPSARTTAATSPTRRTGRRVHRR